MNSNYGKSNNKMGSVNSFDFDLGLGTGRPKPMKDQKNQTSSYASTAYEQKPNTTASWSSQPNKTSWSHQPAASSQSGGAGSMSGPASMVGDIFGKSWNSAAPLNSNTSGVGIVLNKNPNLFGDLLNSAMGHNKSSSNAPLKNAARPSDTSSFSMGGMSDSLPKSNVSAQVSRTWGSNVSDNNRNVNSGGNYYKNSSLGGGNVNLGGNYNNKNPNLGGPSMKSMSGSSRGVGGTISDEDPFASFSEFSYKQSGAMNSASKESGNSGFGTTSYGEFQKASSQTSGSHVSAGAFEASKSNPIDDFGFVNNQAQSKSQPLGKTSGDDSWFAPSFNGGTPTSEGFSNQQLSGDDDWGMNSDFGGVTDSVGTTELEGLPPPPAGVTASAAKNKGMDNYKQGQYADAIKWLSWAVILLGKAGDDDETMDVLICRASCYKEVGEYKKAVADCTKVLDQDGKNVSVLVQRSLLYESMEKYKLGAEDLRTVMRLDPGNRVARSTIHRLTKMAG